jgi:nicotinamidase-related amidase
MPRRQDAPATALLVVDMFNLFDFEGGRPLARAALKAAPRIAALRARFDRAGAPVIYVNDNFSQWRGGFPELVGACQVAGGASAEIAAALAPRTEDYYILKPKHSAFMATALPVLLEKLGARRLVLTGLAADSCILATAQDAHMREYVQWVPGDCVAAITEARRKAALALMSTAMHLDTRTTRSVGGLFP